MTLILWLCFENEIMLKSLSNFRYERRNRHAHIMQSFYALVVKIYVGFEVITAVIMKTYFFWSITPRSPLKVNRRFRGTCRLHLRVRRISQEKTNVKQLSSRASTLKMEATCSSKTSIDIQRTTRRYIGEERTLKTI
jgi:hypothetical protein